MFLNQERDVIRLNYISFFLLKIKHIKRTIGNATADSMPIFILSLKVFATKPTSVGPPLQPKSPAKANKANIAVPPVRKEAAALLKLPGHIIPTERPQMEQPIRLIIGEGHKLMIK